jgi:hypothetical protein
MIVYELHHAIYNSLRYEVLESLTISVQGFGRKFRSDR